MQDHHPGSAGSMYTYPLDLAGNPEYSHRIKFNIRDREKIKSTIFMYMPADALKTTYSQGYGDVDMGAVGAAILRSDASTRNQMNDLFTQKAGGGITDVVIDSVKAAVGVMGSGALGQATQQALLQSTRQKIAASALGGASAVQALEKASGHILNPHKAVVYQGPSGFRVFTYNFTMMPRSAREAEEVAKIVYMFKYHMHPGLSGSDPNKANSANAKPKTLLTSQSLTYPEEFEIELRVNNRESGMTGAGSRPESIKPLFRIGNCFLESCSVDYTTQGSAAFFAESGQPQTTTLSLQFKETVIMTKESIAEGF